MYLNIGAGAIYSFILDLYFKGWQCAIKHNLYFFNHDEKIEKSSIERSDR